MLSFFLQSKLGSLFRPVLPFTHIQEIEPPFSRPKQVLSPEPEKKPEASTVTNTNTLINKDTM